MSFHNSLSPMRIRRVQVGPRLKRGRCLPFPHTVNSSSSSVLPSCQQSPRFWAQSFSSWKHRTPMNNLWGVNRASNYMIHEQFLCCLRRSPRYSTSQHGIGSIIGNSLIRSDSFRCVRSGAISSIENNTSKFSINAFISRTFSNKDANIDFELPKIGLVKPSHSSQLSFPSFASMESKNSWSKHRNFPSLGFVSQVVPSAGAYSSNRSFSKDTHVDFEIPPLDLMNPDSISMVPLPPGFSKLNAQTDEEELTQQKSLESDGNAEESMGHWDPQKMSRLEFLERKIERLKTRLPTLTGKSRNPLKREIQQARKEANLIQGKTIVLEQTSADVMRKTLEEKITRYEDRLRNASDEKRRNNLGVKIRRTRRQMKLLDMAQKKKLILESGENEGQKALQKGSAEIENSARSNANAHNQELDPQTNVEQSVGTTNLNAKNKSELENLEQQIKKLERRLLMGSLNKTLRDRIRKKIQDKRRKLDALQGNKLNLEENGKWMGKDIGHVQRQNQHETMQQNGELHGSKINLEQSEESAKISGERLKKKIIELENIYQSRENEGQSQAQRENLRTRMIKMRSRLQSLNTAKTNEHNSDSDGLEEKHVQSKIMLPMDHKSSDSPYGRITASTPQDFGSGSVSLHRDKRENRHRLSQRPNRTSRGGVLLPSFDDNSIFTQANGTVLGQCGDTSILSTVIVVPPEVASSSPLTVEDGDGNLQTDEKDFTVAQKADAKRILLNAIQKSSARSGSLFVPLQVEYRERFHASGKIPMNQRRKDNSGPLSDREVLAARVVDRTIRPWLCSSSFSSLQPTNLLPDNIFISCQVQSYKPSGQTQSAERNHADPSALAINSAIAATMKSSHANSVLDTNVLPIPSEGAGCVRLAVMRDGAVVFDPAPKELDDCRFHILYAGTRDRVLMLEFGTGSSVTTESLTDPGVEEATVADALRLAHDAIIPIIDQQEDFGKRHAALVKFGDDEALMTDEEVARSLGLNHLAEASSKGFDSSHSNLEENFGAKDGEQLLEQALNFCWTKLNHVALKLFGSEQSVSEASNVATIHEGGLLSKKVRGRRETLLQMEVTRLLNDEFVPPATLAQFHRCALGGNGEQHSECTKALSSQIYEEIMKRAMAASAERGCRSDGRSGLNVVRPITATSPLLPDCVHGSSLFTRGETQVVCTATIGSPSEGLPILSPYKDTQHEKDIDTSKRSNDENIPVGSLRFLRSQVEMESDLNSRKVKAGKEVTGASGTLSEVKRAFLQYDFPDFSTGVVKSKGGAFANRRAIGHGALAEKIVLPALPPASEFPYSIRLTSEVTSSNGSSSMATACGATLALLDAGVPLVPVAGVSVGLAPNSRTLLLDITGTEDHYGDMDFKIGGTYGGITAMQLDVKRPLPLDVIVNALDLAKEGRRAILNAMEKEVGDGLLPRSSLKETAPRVEIIKFDPARKRDLIGPGGAVLRQLEDRFDVSLDLSQEGRCLLYGPVQSVAKAKGVIMDLVADVEEGEVYEGTVIEIKDFGAVIELLRNKEGILHVSEISTEKHPRGNIGLVEDHLKVGDKIEVLCTKIDPVQGSIRLSRKRLLEMRERNAFHDK